MFDHYNRQSDRSARYTRIAVRLRLLTAAPTIAPITVVGLIVGLLIDPVGSFLPNFALVLPFSSLALLIGYLEYRAAQYSSVVNDTLARTDPREPVVYLKPFTTDASAIRLILDAAFRWGEATIEESLSSAVASLGPLVAIGHPDESLPTPGAIRTYPVAGEWHTVVDRWLAEARLVIIRPGETPGVRWEITRALATVGPENLLLLFIKVRKRPYERIAAMMHTEYNIAIPAYRAARRWFRVSGFVAFDQNWTPQFLPLRAPAVRVDRVLGAKLQFHYALRPTFARLGVEWRDTPFAVSKLLRITLILAAPVALLLILVIGLGAEIYGLFTASSFDSDFSMDESSSPAESKPTPWPLHRIAGLSLAAPPCDFVRTDLDPQDTTTITLELHQCTLSDSEEIAVIRRTYREPQILLSPESAAKATRQFLLENTRVKYVTLSASPATLGRYVATRVSWTFNFDALPLKGDMLYFMIGAEGWIISVQVSSSRPDWFADRVFESVVAP